MKKTIILVVLVLMLAGCRFMGERKDTLQLPEVNIGTQGVELSFSPGSPPPEVYENSPFTMLVTLSNLGTSDIEEGVYSTSYDKQYLYVSPQQAIGRYRVRGKSIFMPQGDERQVALRFDAKALGPQMQRYPALIAFNTCYPYTTTAPVIACIDTDFTGRERNKVCVPQPQALPQGQGAPVAVASVEQRMLPHELPNRVIPEFVLTLQNKGTGDVVSAPLFREACSGRPLGEDGWNMIAVEAMLADDLLTCTPTPVKLKKQGDTKVVCRAQDGIEARGTYTELLTVTLNYGYINTITTQVNIVKPLV